MPSVKKPIRARSPNSGETAGYWERFPFTKKIPETSGKCPSVMNVFLQVGGGGGGGATRSGTEKRCSHNLQSGQSAG